MRSANRRKPSGVKPRRRTDQRRHARVVPAVDVLFLDELDQLALGEHHVRQVQARELDLLRQRALQQAAFGQALEQPVVERALVLELQRADRVRDVPSASSIGWAK